MFSLLKLPRKGAAIAIVFLVLVIALMVTFQNQLISIISSQANKLPLLSNTKQPDATINSTTNSKISEVDVAMISKLQNPFAGRLDSCLANQTGSGHCGVKLQFSNENQLHVMPIPDQITEGDKQSIAAMSLFLAKKGSTWRSFLPEIQNTQLSSKTAYFQFFQDLSHLAMGNDIDLGFFAAYYEHLFVTLEKPELQQKKLSILPVPPTLLIERYRKLLKAYTQNTTLTPTQAEIGKHSWSPQAKAIVAASFELLDPAIAEAMFSQEGSLSSSYDQFTSVTPVNQTFAVSIYEGAISEDEFFGKEYRTSTQTNSAPRLAGCRQDHAFVCQLNLQSLKADCRPAPYWEAFCNNLNIFSPVNLVPPEPFPNTPSQQPL